MDATVRLTGNLVPHETWAGIVAGDDRLEPLIGAGQPEPARLGSTRPRA